MGKFVQAKDLRANLSNERLIGKACLISQLSRWKILCFRPGWAQLIGSYLRPYFQCSHLRWVNRQVSGWWRRDGNETCARSGSGTYCVSSDRT